MADQELRPWYDEETAPEGEGAPLFSLPFTLRAMGQGSTDPYGTNVGGNLNLQFPFLNGMISGGVSGNMYKNDYDTGGALTGGNLQYDTEDYSLGGQYFNNGEYPGVGFMGRGTLRYADGGPALDEKRFFSPLDNAIVDNGQDKGTIDNYLRNSSLFGYRNPVREMVDFFGPATNTDSDRPMRYRVLDTIGAVTNLPVRALTQGKYNTVDLVQGITGRDYPRVRESEARFYENNPELLKAAQGIGEVLPLGIEGFVHAPVVGLPKLPEAEAVKQGIKRLAKDESGTFVPFTDLEKLNQAEEMFAAKKHRNDILRETGAIRGADTKWRREIPDNELKLSSIKEGYKGDVYVGDIVEHPELFEAMPDLKNLRFVYVDNPDYAGQYFAFHPKYDPTNVAHGIAIDRSLTAPQQRSVLAHELMHAVQDKAGFAKGSNTSISQKEAEAMAEILKKSPEYHDALKGSISYLVARNDASPLWAARHIDDLDKLISRDRLTPRQIFRLGDWFIDGKDYRSMAGPMPKRAGPNRDEWLRGAAQHIKERFIGRINPQDRKLVDKIKEDFPSLKDRKNALSRVERRLGKFREPERLHSQLSSTIEDLNTLTPREAYERKAGEVEARNVQKRLDFSPQERSERPPWSTESVPPKLQILDADDPSLVSQYMSNFESRYADGGIVENMPRLRPFDRPIRYYTDDMTMDDVLGKDPAPWGYRPNGEPKGRGFLGVLPRPDGNVATELSMNGMINGRDTYYPTLVPTLTKDEINTLRNLDEERDRIPERIADKAYNHAMDRLSKGLSPFATEQEMQETDPALFQFIR